MNREFVNRGFDLIGNWRVTFAAENQPDAICSVLNFARGGNESFDRPAFGRAVFRAGIQAEDRLRDFLQPEFFLRGFNFLRVTDNCGGNGFRIRAQRGGEMQILVDLVSGGREMGDLDDREMGNLDFLISATDRLRIFTASAHGTTAWVRKKFRQGRA